MINVCTHRTAFHFSRTIFLSAAIVSCMVAGAMAQQPPPPPPAAPPPAPPVAASAEPSPDEVAVRKTAAAYVAAFNARDAAALAALWSPEAVYVDRLTGEEVVGQAAIAEQFAGAFKAQAEAKLEVEVQSVQFLSPNVAVEHGISKFLLPEMPPEVIPYSAVYVKRDGQWLLDRVTDEAADRPLSHYEQLKELEWMVGRWVDRSEFAQVETEVNWAKNRNFLTRSFAVSVQDRVEMSGMQVIGWDPAAKTIRSWTFDSDGTFAEGVWTKKGDQWYIHNKGVLADGNRASMVNVIKQVDVNSFTWQTVERTVGGELMPNIEEVLIVRQ